VTIRLDQQAFAHKCPGCGVSMEAVHGSVYDEDRPFAIYLVGLHGCDTPEPLAQIAIAVLDREVAPPRKVAAALAVWPTDEQIEFSFRDWKLSPWQGETYLGEMLDRQDVLESAYRSLFLHIAEHLVTDLPRVSQHLDYGR
jgi:hypothetical protein